MPTRWLVTAPRLVVVAVVAAAAAGTAVSTRGGPAGVMANGLSPGATVAGVVLVGSLVLGLPHGAVDLARLDGSWRDRVVPTGLYLLLTGTAAGCFLLAPPATLIALLVLAVAHFGAADLELHDDVGDAPARRLPRLAVVVATGGVPVAVPLGLHGRAVLPVLDGLTAGHGQLVVDGSRAVLPLLAVAVVVVVVDAARRRRWGVAADLVALLVLFAAVGPLLAFAAYFGLWHAWRQTGLMVAHDARVRQIPPRAAAVRLVRQAAVPSTVSVAAVGVLAVVGDRTVLVGGLAAVLCLTVPHATLTAGLGRIVPAAQQRSTPGRRPGRFVSAA